MRTKNITVWIAKVLLIGVLITGPVSVVQAQGAPPLPEPRTITANGITAYEITTSVVGQKIAQEAILRWASYGVSGNQKIRVFNFGSDRIPDILVLPEGVVFKGASIKVVEVIDLDKKTNKKVVNKVVKVSGTMEILQKSLTTPLVAQGAAYWNQYSLRCFSRYQDDSAWMDTCYKTHVLYNDGDSSKDYWQLEMYATAKSKTHWILRSAQVSASKSSSSPSMSWVDWSPRSDQSVGNCISTTIGVTVKGVGISASRDLCDVWDITKYEAPGSFKTSGEVLGMLGGIPKLNEMWLSWRQSMCLKERYQVGHLVTVIPLNHNC